MKKVFCKDCKYYYDYAGFSYIPEDYKFKDCEHPGNEMLKTNSYEEYIEYEKSADEINANNDCPYFEKKFMAKLFGWIRK